MSSIYVDGFVIPVPTANLDKYREVAQMSAQVWKDHGALDYRECVLDDVTCADGPPDDSEGNCKMINFATLAGAKEDETVIFAYVTYPSREKRDEINAKVMEDERMMNMTCEDVFDFRRMAFSGFRTLVEG